MSLIKVKPWGKDQGEYVLINEEDFNAEVHEPLDAPTEKAKPGRKAKAEQTSDAPAE